MAGKIINDWLLTQKADVARELIIEKTTRHRMTQFVTIPFVRAGSVEEAAETAYRKIRASNAQPPLRMDDPISILRVHDRPTADRLVKRYFSTLRREFDRNLPAVAVSETVKKNGIDSTFLHYHCLIAIPDHEELRFRRLSQTFWGKLGVQKVGFPVKPSIERLISPDSAIRYALKNVDERYPIENIILSGYDAPK
ncbi:hypothetical protein LB521_01195 [Mesorhizobium sp. BR-1-1-8]|uniref:hypothetical protein n=1 Tax=Mesorhizobium sp. BR-1-1-8 TaxID=2876659 RepID=UPI001CCA89E0|nr:hypothetical protein [Mesorhizobium sp. BR-1-1-8]MBZ9979763.1 hypothetical protein [Mesorhizobium sp. BR-1-1-8]